VSVRALRPLALLGGLTALVGCDHVTKAVAKAELEGHGPQALLGSVLELRYTENRDVGFSLLSFIPERVRFPLLLAIGAGALAVLVVVLFRRKHQPLVQVALALILGGALGNYLDRAARGYVVDFIHAAHWPVFNVADIWVTMGGLALLLHTFRPHPAAKLGERGMGNPR
jgi:signal peptidase II